MLCAKCNNCATDAATYASVLLFSTSDIASQYDELSAIAAKKVICSSTSFCAICQQNTISVPKTKDKKVHLMNAALLMKEMIRLNNQN